MADDEKERRPDVELAREADHEAKVKRRMLRFVNEARFAEQLMVAPQDRSADRLVRRAPVAGTQGHVSR